MGSDNRYQVKKPEKPVKPLSLVESPSATTTYSHHAGRGPNAGGTPPCPADREKESPGLPTSSPPFSGARIASSECPTTRTNWTWKECAAGIAEDFSYLRRYTKTEFAAYRALAGWTPWLTGKARLWFFGFVLTALGLLTNFVSSVISRIGAGCAAWWRECGRWYAVGVAFADVALALSYYGGVIAGLSAWWVGLFFLPFVLAFAAASVCSFWIARGAPHV